jgi:uncharacterized protein (TIGR02118 family)
LIVSLSLMQHRSDITIDEFRKHWLDPHGVMTAELPNVRRYVQGHVVESPASNALARNLCLAGFAVLSFNTIEDRQVAYTSPRIRECDKDSEEFVGAVSRVVTESQVVIAPPAQGDFAKAYLLLVGTGGENSKWSDNVQATVSELPDVVGYVRHAVLSQAGAPGSKVPMLDLPIAGVAELWFSDEDALIGSSKQLAEAGANPDETAVYVARDYRLI